MYTVSVFLQLIDNQQYRTVKGVAIRINSLIPEVVF